jgi:hypothetical protein
VHDNLTAAAAGLFHPPDPTLTGVSLTERGAIIARADLGTDDLKLSNPQAGEYQAASVLPLLTGPFRVGGSWLSVDAKVHLVGDTPASRTASGLWPSDHAGLVATLGLGRASDN